MTSSKSDKFSGEGDTEAEKVLVGMYFGTKLNGNPKAYPTLR
jgi:hypothetical protein